MEVNAYDRCYWCHREFADHNYVKDSIDQYECPVPYEESYYGYFVGGDPRDFHPDHESCTPEEIANHKSACEEANRLAAARGLPCPSGWMRVPGGGVAHVTRSPFGIGTGVMKSATCWEPEDRDDTETEDE